MLKIGALSLKYPLVLAPMAGITDLPYRMICRRFGCELAFVEMTSAKALVYGNKKTAKLVATRPEDRPLGIQLLGWEEEFVLRAVDIIQRYEYDIIDFNSACPLSKVTSKGEGCGMTLRGVRLAVREGDRDNHPGAVRYPCVHAYLREYR